MAEFVNACNTVGHGASLRVLVPFELPIGHDGCCFAVICRSDGELWPSIIQHEVLARAKPSTYTRKEYATLIRQVRERHLQ